MTRTRTPVTLGDLRVRPWGDATETSVDLTIGDQTQRWYYRTSGQPVENLDPFLGAVLGTAMKLGGPLILDGPVTDGFLEQCDQIQRLWQLWREDPWRPEHRDFHRVDVLADQRADPVPPGPGHAAFFSSGVDSWAHLLRFQDEIDTIIFFDDWDMVHPPDVRDAVAANVRSAADAMGLGMVRASANTKELLTPYVSWRMLGGFLPSLAVLHAAQFGTVDVPANYDVSGLRPWGSHPLLDPLYSANGQVIRFGPMDRSRLEKTEDLAASEIALRHLRVCWQPAVNCGHCSKCIRTRLSLQVIGALDRATLFPQGPVSPAEVTRAMHDFPDTVTYFAEVAYRLVEEDREPDMVAAIEAGRVPLPQPVARAEALSALAPEPVRRGVRWARSRRLLPRA